MTALATVTQVMALTAEALLTHLGARCVHAPSWADLRGSRICAYHRDGGSWRHRPGGDPWSASQVHMIDQPSRTGIEGQFARPITIQYDGDFVFGGFHDRPKHPVLHVELFVVLSKDQSVASCNGARSRAGLE